jgi:hypothetical protein
LLRITPRWPPGRPIFRYCAAPEKRPFQAVTAQRDSPREKGIREKGIREKGVREKGRREKRKNKLIKIKLSQQAWSSTQRTLARANGQRKTTNPF